MPPRPERLQQQCDSIYNALEVGSEPTDNPKIKVWSGRITELVKQAGVPEGSYKRVMNSLRNMGCIELMRRGYRGDSTSMYLLHYPPTEEVWERFVKSEVADLTPVPTLDSLYAELRDLRTLLGGINLVEAFTNIENRLRQLESQVSKIDLPIV